LIVQGKGKKKTVLRTIRIDKDLDDALYNDAEEHGVSEYALISSGIGVAEDIIPKLFSKFVTKSEKAQDLDCIYVRE
jgi:hypothetical protein